VLKSAVSHTLTNVLDGFQRIIYVDRIVAIALSWATGESIATRVMERDILYPYLSIYLYFLSLSFVVTMRSESISMYDSPNIIPFGFFSTLSQRNNKRIP
jgi:hypothetical protein